MPTWHNKRHRRQKSLIPLFFGTPCIFIFDHLITNHCFLLIPTSKPFLTYLFLIEPFWSSLHISWWKYSPTGRWDKWWHDMLNEGKLNILSTNITQDLWPLSWSPSYMLLWHLGKEMESYSEGYESTH